MCVFRSVTGKRVVADKSTYGFVGTDRQLTTVEA